VHARCKDRATVPQYAPAVLNIRISKARYAEAVNGFRGTLLAALSDVAKGLASRQSLARNRARLSSAFSHGIDSIEVQEPTRQRESALIDNQLERLLSEATLYRALGGSPPASSR
jgi:outer membrane protein TolC